MLDAEKEYKESAATHRVVDSHYVDDSSSTQGFYDPSKESFMTRAGLNAESFKRAPGPIIGAHIDGDLKGEDLERARGGNQLQTTMKNRHLQMIAVGGSIGTGLFVGSGSALRNGGPAGILIAWILIGAMLINVTQALGEMAIVYPVSGGFYTLAARFIDEGAAMAMGWNYVLQWAVVLPLEITVAVTTVNYWNNGLPTAAWVTIFWIAILILSVLGTLGYAEEEFLSSCLKLAVVIMFIIFGIVMICGGGPESGQYGTYQGGAKWQDPGAFANGFKGVCAVFVTAAFSFSGTELVGLAASETANPRAVVPSAVKNTFWRITIIYITSLTIIGLLVGYNDERLLGASGSAASPFVIIFAYANVKGLDHLVNTTIVISVLSIGLSCVYAGSRTLTALAETGFAPRCFMYIDKSGRPLWSVVFILLFAPIAYVGVKPDTSDLVFAWLLALSGLSTLFSWLSISVAHVRFRKAWRVQGHSLEELPFKALFGVAGSWFSIVLIFLVLIAQFYIALWPIGGMSSDSGEVANTFFQAYLAAPVCLLFYVGAYAWKRTTPQRASEMDLDTGRKSWLTVEDMRAWRADRAAAPWHTRMYRALFSN